MSIVPLYSPARAPIEWTAVVADDEEELESEEGEDAELADGDLEDPEFEDGEEFADSEFDDDEDDDDDDEDAPAKAATDEEDDDDEPDPDDVEEDLDTILQDRLASGDDLEDDDDEDEDEGPVTPPIQATESDKVAPKAENEWTCNGCFLIVSTRQFGKPGAETCPSGESDCPSLSML